MQRENQRDILRERERGTDKREGDRKRDRDGDRHKDSGGRGRDWR